MQPALSPEKQTIINFNNKYSEEQVTQAILSMWRGFNAFLHYPELVPNGATLDGLIRARFSKKAIPAKLKHLQSTLEKYPDNTSTKDLIDKLNLINSEYEKYAEKQEINLK